MQANSLGQPPRCRDLRARQPAHRWARLADGARGRAAARGPRPAVARALPPLISPMPPVPRVPGRNTRPWGPELDGGAYLAPTRDFPVRLDATWLADETPAAVGAELADTAQDCLDDPARGALLVRGLRFWRGEDVSALFHALRFGAPPAGRWGAVDDGLFDVTAVPSTAVLSLRNAPGLLGGGDLGRIALVCLRPALDGGETLLGRGADIARSIGGRLLDAIERRGGVFCRRWLPAQARVDAMREGNVPQPVQSWSEFFGTGDLDRVAELIGRGGFRMDEDEQGGIFVSGPPRPPCIRDPETGARLWHNFGTFSECFAFQTFFYGNGSPMAEGDVTAIKDARTINTYALALAGGDVLMLNNRRVQHGRAPYGDAGRRMRAVPG